VVRVLSQVAEDTVYTFAMLLAVYLVGSAAGAAFYSRRFAAHRDPARLRTQLLCAQAIACLVGGIALWEAGDLHHVALHAFGSGMPAALGCEALLAAAAFALPTFVMGMLFSHLCVQAREEGRSFGAALGFNTLGAAFAPPLFGVLAVPLIGPKFVLVGLVVGYLLLALPRAWRSPVLWLPAGASAALAVWAPTLAFVDVPDGGRIVRYEEGAMAAVSVVEDAEGVVRLRIDNRQQEGSSATVLADARQALLPLLLHPAPHKALFLGLGTGITASSAAGDLGLQVDAVELLPEVIAVAPEFERAFTDGTPHATPRLIHADARRFVSTTEQHYDLIVADNFHPARSGSGALYTVEHFAAVRERLDDGGVFCQWLPLHQLDLQTLRSIVQSFVAVNPEGFAMLATNSLETPVLGLVARRGGEHFSLDAVRAHLASHAQPLQLDDYGLVDEWALLGGFVAGPSGLRRFAGDAPLNTDDHPVVAYRAPRVTYAPDASPRERLWALLAELRIEAPQLLANAPEGDARRLAAYWAARDRFLEAGRGVQPSNDPRRMLEQVRDPLLSVLRVSPDFRPAYDPLLRIGMALARSDRDAARSLLAELARLQPARPEAAQALAALDGAAR
jgi:spermidine synthase